MTERLPQNSLTIALAQMCSGNTHAANIATVSELAARASGAGAAFLALPEVAGLMNRNRAEAAEQIGLAETDPFIAACRDLAAKHGLWIHTGSTPVRAPDGRAYNQSHVIDATGTLRARYNKIHLFDIDIPGKASFTESSAFAPGDEAVLLDTPWGAMGLSICYDLRFPGLYRSLAQAGARVLFVPAAFTVPTGEAHWHTLLRARAIETGAFVIAPAQGGIHEDGRKTYGHALCVDPWGRVLADLGNMGPDLRCLTLDLAYSDEIRAQIPSLRHGRDVPLRRV